MNSEVHTRSIDIKGNSGKISDRNENWKNVIGNWRKGDPCYKMTKNFAELCCITVEDRIASYEAEYLAEEISKQNVEAAAWFLMAAYSKM